MVSVAFERGSRLERIGERVFMDTAISDLSLPNSVRAISSTAFAARALKSVSFSPASVHFCVLADQVLDISKGALVRNLVRSPGVVIAPLIKILCAFCFALNDFLQSVIFESGSRLWVFEEYAFYQSRLAAIVIPVSVERISRFCFYRCDSLVSVAFESGSRLQQIEDSAFCQTGVTRIVIATPVEVLCRDCFCNCQSLSSVEFEYGSHLQRIESSALSRTGLTAIIVPASVKVLCSECFAACRSLSSVAFEPGSQLRQFGPNCLSWSPADGNVALPGSLGTGVQGRETTEEETN
jgi:hypothetical protein